MQERLEIHQAQRKEKFISIEEPIYLAKVLVKGTYLVDCLSMWILNTLDREMEELFNELESLVQKRDIDIIFVLNDVSSGVIPMDKESRKFVDRSGAIGQRVASFCDEVYDVKLGIGVRLK
jgi:adenosylcobinamide kinase/adenosylcobinamide-phosphate guanylyltransferase